MKEEKIIELVAVFTCSGSRIKNLKSRWKHTAAHNIID
jgi:hypothetical protein